MDCPAPAPASPAAAFPAPLALGLSGVGLVGLCARGGVVVVGISSRAPRPGSGASSNDSQAPWPPCVLVSDVHPSLLHEPEGDPVRSNGVHPLPVDTESPERVSPPSSVSSSEGPRPRVSSSRLGGASSAQAAMGLLGGTNVDPCAEAVDGLRSGYTCLL